MHLVTRTLALFLAFAGAACAGDLPWTSSQQLVLVITPDWDANAGVMQAFERDGRAWKFVSSSQTVTVGRAGSAWGLGLHPAMTSGPIKREGDGRSPAGVFPIGVAFGYAPSVPTALQYRGMTASDYCIDVPESTAYNKILDASVAGEAAVKGSTEPMRRDLHANGDQRYKLGFVIEHNADGQPPGGSCIFAHLWKAPGEPTAGCTAMAEPAMRGLLDWLSADARPVFVLLPRAEYERLHREWDLPDAP